MDSLKRTLAPAGAVLGGIVTIVSLALDGFSVASFGLPFRAWEAIGFAVALISVLAIEYAHRLEHDRAQARGLETSGGVTIERTDVVRDPGGHLMSMTTTRGDETQSQSAEFYEERQTPIWYSRQIKHDKTPTWVLWNSGSTLLHHELIDKRANLKRIILPDPTNQHLAALVTPHSSIDELRRQIVRVGEVASGAGIDVRWWGGPLPTNLVTITENWALVETVFPHLSLGHRPQYRVWRDRQPRAYERLRSAYDEMWRASNVLPYARVTLPTSDTGDSRNKVAP